MSWAKLKEEQADSDIPDINEDEIIDKHLLITTNHNIFPCE